MPLITSDENRLLIGLASASGCGVPERWDKDGCPLQSCPLSPGQESRGPLFTQLHLPGSLRCWGGTMLTLEPTGGQAADPTGLTFNPHPVKSHPVPTLPPRGSPLPVGDPESRSATAPQSPGRSCRGTGAEEEARRGGRRGRKSHLAPSPPPQLELPGAIRLPSLRSRLITARPPALANQGR